ncbi:MAG: hypothetical protein HY719_10200 [Planctomycetes bacterium]|nr:hypothetical protein [Planctomycetota bacterium]
MGERIFDNSWGQEVEDFVDGGGQPLLDAIPDPGGAGGVIDLGAAFSAQCDLAVTDIAETGTVPAPAGRGRQLLLNAHSVAPGGARVVTVTGGLGGAMSMLSFNTEGGFALLLSIAVGAGFGWRLVAWLDVGVT